MQAIATATSSANRQDGAQVLEGVGDDDATCARADAEGVSCPGFPFENAVAVVL